MKLLFFTMSGVHHPILKFFSDSFEEVYIVLPLRHKKKFEFRLGNSRFKNFKAVYTKSHLGMLLHAVSLLFGEKKFDIAVYNCPLSGFFGTVYGLLSGKRHIFLMCQDFVEYFEVNRAVSGMKKRVMLPVLKFLLRFSCSFSEVVVLSNYLAERARFYGAKRVVIIPVYGVDSSVFKKRSAVKLKKKLGLAGSRVVLSASRLSPEKGLDFLLKAFFIVKNKVSNLKLVVIGTGPDEAFLKEFSDNQFFNDIVFTGFVEPSLISEYYNLADVFVMPSLKEGLGFSAAEALASEVPVVASDVGGIPDIVINGKTGILVSPGNADELANSILSLLRNRKLAKRLASTGRKHIIQNFEMKRVFKRFLEYVSC